MTEEPIFVVSFAISGGVDSASYSAGVMDFFIRAISQHNLQVGEPGGPRHRIAIKSISGASAGGTTAALTAASVVEGIGARPAALRVRDETHHYEYGLRLLHEAWVERLDISAGPDPLLGSSDLRGGGQVRSFLDSKALGRQLKSTFNYVAWSGERYDWIASDFELFITLGDLEGILHEIPTDNDSKYRSRNPSPDHLKSFSWTRHFRVKGLGLASIDSPWLDMWRDSGIPLLVPCPGEPLPLHEFSLEWGALHASSLASIASPGMMAPQPLRVDPSELWSKTREGFGRGGAMPLALDPELSKSSPGHSSDWTPQEEILLFGIDGGALNNYVRDYSDFSIRRILENKTQGSGRDRQSLAPLNISAEESDRAVVMIDPTPDRAILNPTRGEDATNSIFSILTHFRNVVTSQNSFRFDEVYEGTDEENHAFFHVSPSRSLSVDDSFDERANFRRLINIDSYGSAALASSVDIGFGGLVSENFRRHDFILGQRNCQSFLINQFRLSEANPVLCSGALGSEGRNKAPIVHLSGYMLEPIPLPPWPLMEASQVNRVIRFFDRRMRDLIYAETKNIVGRGPFAWFLRTVVGLSFGRRWSVEIRSRIFSSLSIRDLD